MKATFEDPLTGVRTTISTPSEGTHLHLKVLRRYVRTTPLLNKQGKQIGWYTKPADWYLAWGARSRYGTKYHYEGLENEKGFKTKKKAETRKKEIYKEMGWSR